MVKVNMTWHIMTKEKRIIVISWRAVDRSGLLVGTYQTLSDSAGNGTSVNQERKHSVNNIITSKYAQRNCYILIYDSLHNVVTILVVMKNLNAYTKLLHVKSFLSCSIQYIHSMFSFPLTYPHSQLRCFYMPLCSTISSHSVFFPLCCFSYQNFCS